MENIDTSAQFYPDELPEESQPAYLVEYAKSGRSTCKGRKPCQGMKIGKDELRLGVLVTINENESYAFRHWGCVTTQQFRNMQDMYVDASQLGGFGKLRVEDQERVKRAFDASQIAPEDLSFNAPEAVAARNALASMAQSQAEVSNAPASPEEPIKSEEDREIDNQPRKKPPRKRKAVALTPVLSIKAERGQLDAEEDKPGVSATKKRGRAKKARVELKEQSMTPAASPSSELLPSELKMQEDVKPLVGPSREAGSSEKRRKPTTRKSKPRARPAPTQADGTPVRRSTRRIVKEEATPEREEIKPKLAGEGHVRDEHSDSSSLTPVEEADEVPVKREDNSLTLPSESVKTEPEEAHRERVKARSPAEPTIESLDAKPTLTANLEDEKEADEVSAAEMPAMETDTDEDECKTKCSTLPATPLNSPLSVKVEQREGLFLPRRSPDATSPGSAKVGKASSAFSARLESSSKRTATSTHGGAPSILNPPAPRRPQANATYAEPIKTQPKPDDWPEWAKERKV